MTTTFLRIAPLALSLLAAPAVLVAQEPAPAPTSELEADSAATARIQSWLGEIQQINGRLQALQQQALEDPTLSSEQEALGDRIRAAMAEADPTLEASMERVESLQAEAAAAQQQGNTARLEELGAEVRRIEAQFMEAQQQALSIPELSADLESFQARLEAKIVEIDAEAPQLIARFQELQERLASAMRMEG